MVAITYTPLFTNERVINVTATSQEKVLNNNRACFCVYLCEEEKCYGQNRIAGFGGLNENLRV